MDTRVETAELVQSHSLIDVRGGGFDSLLLVGGKPIALNWCDCEGSVGQYMVRAGSTDCEKKLRSLRHLVEGNVSAQAPLTAQLQPFLELFVPGRYRILYYESCPDCDCIKFNTPWMASRDFDQFYPMCHVLVFTQAVDSLNSERVAYHLERIRNGHRPLALTATTDDGWCEFVIDGHHKLQAYSQAGIDPSFISVCRLDAPRLSADSLSELFDAGHPMADQYRRVKTQYGSERFATE